MRNYHTRTTDNQQEVGSKVNSCNKSSSSGVMMLCQICQNANFT